MAAGTAQLASRLARTKRRDADGNNFMNIS
jgi:hypothetical protein